ncbi:uncharacterized protein RJT20DRAFT_247 [Scheffersomyces xylosifermentans]|uniref:uncharacterized protein n=1 Tax=Scheffersomyces xylosifermentans TaxID=1304137 RepID=UPI00315D02DA
MRSYNESDDSAVAGLMNLVFHLQEGVPDKGTGIAQVLKWGQGLLGPKLPDILLEYNIRNQNNLFGGYVTKADFAPAMVFTVVFAVLGLFHLILFAVNFSRGHYFWMSLYWVFHCMMKVTGFGMRASWSLDITKLPIGLASEVLCIVPVTILLSINLILAQRLFTWRHPVGGSRKLFWGFMIGLYAGVSVIVAIAITASLVPYLYYMSTAAYNKWRHVVQATSVLLLVYSMTSIALIGLSYWAPTKKDENLYTYQPWWIESFHPFYFVQPFAAQKAEETFMKRNHNHRHAIRVIAATHHDHNMVQGLSNQRGDLKHNKSIIIVIATTALTLIGSISRGIVTFRPVPYGYSGPESSAILMYFCWGVSEVFVHLIYLIGRVDLRFYRPDTLPAKVRAIITSEQTYYPSDNEEEEEDYDVGSEVESERRFRDDHFYGSKSSQEDDEWKFVDVEDSSDTSYNHHKPPYPYDKNEKSDVRSNHSEFVF